MDDHASWQNLDYRVDRRDYLKKVVPQNCVIGEIGVFQGELTVQMLRLGLGLGLLSLSWKQIFKIPRPMHFRSFWFGYFTIKFHVILIAWNLYRYLKISNT